MLCRVIHIPEFNERVTLGWAIYNISLHIVLLLPVLVLMKDQLTASLIVRTAAVLLAVTTTMVRPSTGKLCIAATGSDSSLYRCSPFLLQTLLFFPKFHSIWIHRHNRSTSGDKKYLFPHRGTQIGGLGGTPTKDRNQMDRKHSIVGSAAAQHRKTGSGGVGIPVLIANTRSRPVVGAAAAANTPGSVRPTLLPVLDSPTAAQPKGLPPRLPPPAGSGAAPPALPPIASPSNRGPSPKPEPLPVLISTNSGEETPPRHVSPRRTSENDNIKPDAALGADTALRSASQSLSSADILSSESVHASALVTPPNLLSVTHPATAAIAIASTIAAAGATSANAVPLAGGGVPARRLSKGSSRVFTFPQNTGSAQPQPTSSFTRPPRPTVSPRPVVSAPPLPARSGRSAAILMTSPVASAAPLLSAATVHVVSSPLASDQTRPIVEGVRRSSDDSPSLLQRH